MALEVKPLSALAPAAAPVASRSLDLRGGLGGRAVTSVGRLANLSPSSFAELVERHGGRHTLGVGVGVAFVVVGAASLPVTDEGRLPRKLREARLLQRREHANLRVVGEEQFLAALGLGGQGEGQAAGGEPGGGASGGLYPLSRLTALLGVSRQRVRRWVALGLIEPARSEHGVWFFDFRRVAAAKAICDLAARGVTAGRLRLSLRQLAAWLPEAAEDPLRRLAELEDAGGGGGGGGGGRLLVRLGAGELAEVDGQLHFDFDAAASAGAVVADEEQDLAALQPVLRIVPGPRTAQQWFEQACEQEAEGLAEEAAESYRAALRLAGQEVGSFAGGHATGAHATGAHAAGVYADACFNLANVLRGLGRREQALERYWQVVEADPGRCGAWNNLGLTLAELGRAEEAAEAFAKAVSAGPHDPAARYNLADALEDLGRTEEASPHWRAYLRASAGLSDEGPWAEHARRCLARRRG